MPVRTIVVWCPRWSVLAAARAAGHDPAGPIAVLDRGRVHACSPAASELGVQRDMRRREAQSRCPDLVVLPHDPAIEARAFEPVVAAVETLVPHVEIIRPGVCAVAARGPTRYFGSESAVAEQLRATVRAAGVEDCRIGIADGPFTAAQAARHERIVPPGGSAEFLGELPIDTIERPRLVGLLRRLGIRTLGDFAALPHADVIDRFGAEGDLAYRLAIGDDDRLLATRRPDPELTVDIELDPPVDRIDTVTFVARAHAERLVAELALSARVCTCLRIQVYAEDGTVGERRWMHPRWFTPSDVVDRIRWQLQGTQAEADSPPSERATAGIVRVRLLPDEVDRIGEHAAGLWDDQASTERVHRTLARVQSMIGHEAVLTPVRSGGRELAERVTFVPWGDRAGPTRPTEPPWPGRLGSPSPATVLAEPVPAVVLAADGEPVRIDDRDTLSAAPASVGLADRSGAMVPVLGWAGPWPVLDRWWDPATARQHARFQLACADGRAWLLSLQDGRWWMAGSYD